MAPGFISLSKGKSFLARTMLYDRHPTYEHQSHLPYAHEPLKSLYVFQRLCTTILLVPYWVAKYSFRPRSDRPRKSWSLRQIVNVNFTRRIYKVTEVAGVTWGTRNPEEEPPPKSLKETTFQWVPPLDKSLRTGIVVNGNVPFKKVGTFIWSNSLPLSYDIGDGPLIGIFMHGGGYCHMSAHESSRTSRIPRHLIKNKNFYEIHAVEYRLLQYAPFPAVIQDAAAVYADIIRSHPEGCRIVLIGDSSGGNLVLALVRWIRDEGALPIPHGLLLLSPSCDTSHAFPAAPSAYIPRPNASTDYLVDTPEPRALLQRTFLGFTRSNPSSLEQEEEHRLMQTVHSEYVSPASPKVLRRWGHPVAYDDALAVQDGVALKPNGDVVVQQADVTAFDSEATPNLEPLPFAYPQHKGGTTNILGISDTLAVSHVSPGRLITISAPSPSASKRPSQVEARGLFTDFPRTLIVIGDAERLEREVRNLEGGMLRDGVNVRTVWARDAVHDILIMKEGWWDEKVREGVWRDVDDWVEGM